MGHQSGHRIVDILRKMGSEEAELDLEDLQHMQVGHARGAGLQPAACTAPLQHMQVGRTWAVAGCMCSAAAGVYKGHSDWAGRAVRRKDGRRQPHPWMHAIQASAAAHGT